ncbi:hypothetical protein DH2020_040537 [Rehmannia glutinosa]|uniref:RNase H type-1 domain-containing protein n=1 Tax=Rehmannia glutinosa TaxID=99300 RepID=A0ABR0USM5_REHGL
MESLPDDIIEFICITAWCIWTARNSFYFEQTPFNAEKIRMKAQSLFLETNGSKPTSTRKTHAIPDTVKWKPPGPGTLKLNSDAAIFKGGTVGLGFIIRDQDGLAVLAGSKKSGWKEVALWRKAWQSYADLRGFYVESDCKILIDGLQGKAIPDTHGDLISEDILDAATELDCVNFSFIPRETNNVAHSLARFCNDNETEHIWLGSIPPCMEGILLSDITFEE